MLKHITAKNYILIDDMSLNFDYGLTCITGETGSGKSIIIEILDAIWNSKKVNIAKDNSKDVLLKAMFFKNSKEIEIKRTIIGGKSSFYLDNKKTNSKTLFAVCSNMFDMVNQFDNINYLKEKNHINILDSFIGQNDTLKDYRLIFENYKYKKISLQKLVEKKTEYKKNLKLFSHYLDELNDANLISKEDLSLTNKLKNLENSEKLSNLIKDTSDVVLKENGIKELFLDLISNVKKLNLFDNTISYEKISSIYYEFDDFSSTLFSKFDYLSSTSNESKDDIENRLDIVENLKLKYKKNTIDDLILYRDELDYYVNSQSLIDADIENLQKILQDEKVKLIEISSRLTDIRVSNSLIFTDLINEFLEVIGLKNTKISIRVFPKSKFDDNGKDNITICVNSQNEQNFSITDILSGGELSRLLLVIKTLIHKNDDITIIMDEIESGVAGETVLKVGKYIKKISNEKQIICITHSPSIAVFSDNHIRVNKDDNNTVKIELLFDNKLLNDSDITIELARMIGNSKDKHAIDYARELIRKYRI